MSVKTPRFEGPFKWSALRQQLLSLRDDVQSISKIPGHNVTIDEHRGKGKVINVASDASRRGGGGGGVTGACCYDDGTCDDLTEADCTEAGGNWQGSDTTCEDVGICVGACCEGEDGTTCVDNSTPDSCAADGGTWTDFGVTCDSSPCALPPCNGCGFDAFDGSGRKFLTRTTVTTINQIADCAGCGTDYGNPTDTGEWTCISSYDAECNLTEDISGSETATFCDGRVTHPGSRCACFGDVISATEKHYFNHDTSDPCLDQTIESTCTLSNECTP